MLAIEKRSSIESEERPSPENSIDLYKAPSTPIMPIMWSITSLPLTHFLSFPVRLNFIAEGTLNHAYPVAIPAAISVEPTPVEKAPRAPYVQVWLSAPIMHSPLATSPFSGSRACSIPISPTSK